MMIRLRTMKAMADDMTRGAAGSKGASESGNQWGTPALRFPHAHSAWG